MAYDYINATGTNPYYGGSSTAPFPVEFSGKTYVLKRVVNITTAEADLNSGNAFAQNDVLELINIPADTLIECVRLEITTKGTDSSLTYDIGDGDDPNGWIDGQSATADAGINNISKVYADGDTVEQKADEFYTTADTIDVVLEGATPTNGDGVFTLWVFCVDFS